MGKLKKVFSIFFIVCNRVLPHVTAMKIDEQKEHVLTNYARMRIDGKVTDSDHNTQYMDLNLEMENTKPEKREILDLKNKAGQEKFKKVTSEKGKFVDCFKTNAPLEIQIENWREILRSSCYDSFPKIKIRKRKKVKVSQEISKLIKLKNKMITTNRKTQADLIESINRKISDIEAEEKRNDIVKSFQYFSENPEKIEMSKMWKILNRIWPKFNSQATAKRNHLGDIISNPKALKTLLVKEYKERLRSRPAKTELKHLMILKKKISNMKLKLASFNKTPDWNIKDLDKALAKLKNNKSRDFEGLSNEIFKENIIGNDLKESLLIIFNNLKKNNQIPKFFNYANITTVPKKGSRLILSNERGIFRVSIIRSILMNLIYDRHYPEVDKNISECQMGGRRLKSSKNNIFIINGIIHDVMASRKPPVVLQYYDYSQMFDSMNLDEAISDIYNTGLSNDTLGLIYKSNKEVSMAIKTPHGLTDRQTVTNIVLQGDKFGSLLAAVQVDRIGQACMEAGYNYFYKNELPIGFLGMVDDIVGITQAGYKASQLNCFLNVKTSEKTLQFGASKCQYMVVGRNPENITQNKLQVDQWKKEYKKNNSAEGYEMVEYFDGQADIKQTEQYKYLGFVISSKGDNMANIRNIISKSIGVTRKIHSKLKSLNLKQYYFECSIILMNVLLRGSILYAAELFYNLKENELRKIERIEEEYMRKILKTSRGCPITSLYLTLGQIPARFAILKMRLLYIKYILHQPEESNIYRMLILQLENPTRGDWASSCMKDLENINLKLTLDEIKSMKKKEYAKILKQKVEKAALKYLLDKRGKKGIELEYSCIEMAEYLLPFNRQTVEDKCELFAVKNSMINIPSNFSSKDETKCECGALEKMAHIYECDLYNNEKLIIPFEKIFNGNLKEQIKVYEKFKQNMKKRKLLKETSYPCDLFDPLLCSKG